MLPVYSMMSQRRSDLIPVVFKTWIQGTVCTHIDFMELKETMELDPLNFEWEWINKLTVMGMVQQVASVGKNNNFINKWKNNSKEEPKVALIVSEGIMKAVNKILKSNN